ncbi:hypothetical protein L1987_30248 [Smallanthus sonchifolius]|uniref:Uncharacterized protein n=1 Tax=Smallanthus sonchifolius TaxID=185202 RepID=A0ACB9I4Y2_9ASTR|nr:hypothetical protein L1987_30248 [Smallanthus sonchifolius]
MEELEKERLVNLVRVTGTCGRHEHLRRPSVLNKPCLPRTLKERLLRIENELTSKRRSGARGRLIWPTSITLSPSAAYKEKSTSRKEVHQQHERKKNLD